MNSKYSRLLRTILTTGLAFVVNYGINLILTPYITDTVGTEAYGFVALAKNFAQYASIITIALNSFAARYIAVEYHQKNYTKANVYFSSVFFGDLFLGSAIFAVAILMIHFLESFLVISSDIVGDVKILFSFVFVNFWLTTVFTVFSSSALIKSKLDIIGVLKGISYIVEAFVLIVLYLNCQPNVYYVGIGLVFASLVLATTNYVISRKYTPELIISRKYFSFTAIRRLVIDGTWTSVTSLGNILNNGLDLIVCNLMLTSLQMGQLAIAKTIDTIFHSLYQLVAQAFQPMLLKSYADNDKKKLLKELGFAMKLSGLFSNLAFAGFLALGTVYYKLWIPHQDIELIYKLTVITILTSIPTGPMQPLYYIYTLTVKRVVPCIVTLSSGVFNVMGMYLLIKYTGLGVYAVVLTTACVMFFINYISNPLYMAYVLKLRWTTFYPNIIRNTIACAVLSMTFMGMSYIYKPSSWITLCTCIIFYVLIGSLIHLVIVCDSVERETIIKILRRKKV